MDAVTEAKARLLADLNRNQAVLSRLEQDHLNLIQASQSSNADDEHDPEGATIAFEREQLVSIMARMRRTVTELQQSLNDLDDGSYGVCQFCGKPIDPARLEVRPQARSCIACAQRRR